MIRAAKFAVVFGGIALSACAPRATSGPAPVAGPVSTTPAVDTAPPRVVLALNPAPSTYRVESRSVIFSAADATVPLDSILLSSTAQLRLRREPNGTVVISGIVDRLSVSSGLGSARQTQSLQSPYSMEWVQTGDSTQPPARPASTPCDQLEESARDLLLSILPALPDTVSRNATWRNSRSIESCRGGVTIRLVTASSAHAGNLDSARTARALPFESTAQISVNGNGAQGSTNIVLKGSGTMSSRYLFNLATGAVQSGTSEMQLQLDFDLGYRTDKLIQRTSRTITRINNP